MDMVMNTKINSHSNLLYNHLLILQIKPAQLRAGFFIFFYVLQPKIDTSYCCLDMLILRTRQPGSFAPRVIANF